jgi:hypothetical protein
MKISGGRRGKYFKLVTGTAREEATYCRCKIIRELGMFFMGNVCRKEKCRDKTVQLHVMGKQNASMSATA